MTNKGYGNFAFLCQINEDLYRALYAAEKNARIDVYRSGNDLRKALEIFVKQVADDHGLTCYIRLGTEMNLFECIDRMNDIKAMRTAGFLKANQTFQDKPLLPHCDSISYTRNNGQKGYADVYSLLRMVGNAGSHTKQTLSAPKMNFETISTALKGMHTILKAYYKKNDSPRFDKNRMPIQDFVVTGAYAPQDKDRSRCRMEFVAHTVDANGEPEFHALLRLYEREDLDVTFMRRNRECFVEASKVSISGVPDGMTRLRELTDRGNVDNEFYIIAYIFNREAKPLNNTVVAQMSLDQRLDLCVRLAQCMNTLHNSETPIYHRLLNHECIYISQFQSNGKAIWAPYIVKLDYAKISIDSRGTVIVQAQEANAIMRELTLNKFIPLEWQNKDSDSTDVDWGKVDVYSLGVLMGDILSGQLNSPRRITSQDLEDLDISDEILDMLDSMQADAPGDRPTISQVSELFTREAG